MDITDKINKYISEDKVSTQLGSKTESELHLILRDALKLAKAQPNNPKYQALADKAKAELNKRISNARRSAMGSYRDTPGSDYPRKTNKWELD